MNSWTHNQDPPGGIDEKNIVREQVRSRHRKSGHFDEYDPYCLKERTEFYPNGRLRFIRDARAHHQMLDLCPGDNVYFTSEMGQKITGTLIKIKLNRKTVSLCTHDGHHWRVSPSLLTRAEPKEVKAEVEQKKPEPHPFQLKLHFQAGARSFQLMQRD